MRKFRLPLVLLLLVAGFIGWRASRPHLTDEQQIAANLDAICAAASARNPRGVADFLAKNFKAGSLSKSEFQNAFATGILQYRVVDLGVSGVQHQVQGESATSAGSFNLSLKFEHNSQPELKGGKFNLKWRKIDGEWKIVTADVPNLGQFGG